MEKWNVDIADVERRITDNELTAGDIDDLLIRISWTKHPKVIKKLINYKASPGVVTKPKTLAELKKEWKTEKLENGTLRILQYKGADTNITIPAAIGQGIVAEIGDFAFSPLQPRIVKDIREARKKITSISMPDSIVRIGESAFSGCVGLKTIILPNGINVIGKSAFAHCENLETIILPENINYLPESLFQACKKMTKINIPSSVTIIERRVFDECESLEEVVLPKGIKRIRMGAFYECVSLKGVVIPEGVEKIGVFAFDGCKKLKKLRIPLSVNEIDSYSFNKGTTLILNEESPLIKFCEAYDISFIVE